MSDIYILESFDKAINRLEEVLALEKTECPAMTGTGVIRDSAIKRFELCFDLAWKSIKVYANGQGIECYSPKECFKSAFQLNLIDYDEIWLNMLNDRNLTTHLYKEEYAEEVYSRLLNYLGLFKKLLKALK
ncbi:MAG: HI0074 family nucleotidyltransferase substrate-binding subunit [bacterium]